MLCHLWIFAKHLCHLSIGCSLFGCASTIVSSFSVSAPWRIQGSAKWCPLVPLGVLWCSLSPGNSSMVQPQSVSTLTRRFVHIKEQRLLDKAADWNALVRNLKLDKGRSAKGGNSGVKLFMPNSPTWIPSFGFQERLEEVNWKDLTYEHFMTCLGLSLKFFILFCAHRVCGRGGRDSRSPSRRGRRGERSRPLKRARVQILSKLMRFVLPTGMC